MTRYRFAILALSLVLSMETSADKRRIVSHPPSSCQAPTVTLTLARSTICPGETTTLFWKASDTGAFVTIIGIGNNLAASGSTIVGTTFTTSYSARATTACGTSNEALAVLVVSPSATGSVNTPGSVQQGATTTLAVTVGSASAWTLSSALGNTLSPSSGTSTGTLVVNYTATHSGTDTITLSANGSCGTVQRSGSIAVGSVTPNPTPQPTGYLRCCDGTFSPTCTNCASKQGCCSHHGGVCGCL
jgi:hypothetical protein